MILEKNIWILFTVKARNKIFTLQTKFFLHQKFLKLEGVFLTCVANMLHAETEDYIQLKNTIEKRVKLKNYDWNSTCFAAV